ncbi:MAG: magnesium transporter CorA family protein [Lachnospiraceae bacterium]|nr:magnesium transporter CorA family protein [Lachnospiraceae bacterium]
MIRYYRTENGKIHEKETHEPGGWIMAVAPTYEESVFLANSFDVDVADIRAAMDDEESSRVDVSNDYTLIVVDIPAVETRHEQDNYTTIPLGMIINDSVIITVCSEDTPVLQYFVKNNVKEFSTKKQMRFVYQILYKTCMVYQNNLRVIDKKRTEIEERIKDITEDSDLIALHELESTLVYFATSLRANGAIIERLTRYGKIRQYQEDQELLEDVIVENKQAIEMTGIYRDILNGTRELLSTLIDNRLNTVMKYLAAITIVMSVPNIISGLYGMNVAQKWVPFAQSPYGFAIISGFIVLLCVIVLIVLRRRKMF